MKRGSFFLSLLLTLCLYHATEGLYREICVCNSVYVPPGIRSVCQSFLSPCPCPGEVQATEKGRISLLAVADLKYITVNWNHENLLDYVRINISVTGMPTSGRLESNWFQFNNLEIDQAYELSFCAIHLEVNASRECGCYNFTLTTSNNKMINNGRLIAAADSPRITMAFTPPNDLTGHIGYRINYRPVSSDQQLTVFPDPASLPPYHIVDALPNTLYAVSVTSLYNNNEEYTTGENITLTSFDSRLLLVTLCGAGELVTVFRFLPTCMSNMVFIQDAPVASVSHASNVGLYVLNHQFFYASFYNGSVIRANYYQDVSAIKVTSQEVVLQSVGTIDNGTTLAYDPSNEQLYWMESNKQVYRQGMGPGSPEPVIDSVDNFNLDSTFGFLYWSNSSGVYRCSLIQSEDCRANSQSVFSGPTSTFTVDKANRLIYQVGNSQLRVLSVQNQTVLNVISLNFDAQFIFQRDTHLYIQNSSLSYDIISKDMLQPLCITPPDGCGCSQLYEFTHLGEGPFIPPNPPSSFNFELSSSPPEVRVRWLSPSNGDPNYPTNAPWNYVVSWSVDSGGEVMVNRTQQNSFTIAAASPGNPVSVYVKAEGQPGQASLSGPQFRSVLLQPGITTPPPLLVGDSSGVYSLTLSATTSANNLCSGTVKGLTRDVFRNVTYAITEDNKIIRCLSEGVTVVLSESQPIHSLSVDWVANKLYWIRSGTKIMSCDVASCNPTIERSGNFVALQVEPHQGLLFFGVRAAMDQGDNVELIKVNGLTPSGQFFCNVANDPVLALALDVAGQRVYWVTSRPATTGTYRLLLNWVDYSGLTCNQTRGWTVIPEVVLSSPEVGCGLAVGNGLVVLKVEGVTEVWTTPIAVLEGIPISASPGLTRYSLDTRSEASSAVVFQNLDLIFPNGLMADSIVVPQGFSVAQQDSNAGLNSITVSWSIDSFTLSEVIYRYMLSLTRLDGFTATANSTTMGTTVLLTNQQPYTVVEGTVQAFSLWGSTDPVAVSFRSSSDVPSRAVGNVSISVYNSGSSSSGVSAVVTWSKLTDSELRGEFVQYTVRVNSTDIPIAANSILLRDNIVDGFELVSNETYCIEVFVVTNFGPSPGSTPECFRTSDISPALGIIVAGNLVGEGGATATTALGSPLAYDTLTSTYFGMKTATVIAMQAVTGNLGIRDLYEVEAGSQVLAISLDWIAKIVYAYTYKAEQLVVKGIFTQNGNSFTVATQGISPPPLAAAISPLTNTLYFLPSDGAIFSVELKTTTVSTIRSAPNERRRKRQTCSNPLGASIVLATDLYLEARTDRVWFSDITNGQITSCSPSGSNFCDCMVEVPSSVDTPASLPASYISLDELRIYWAKRGESIVYYVERSAPTTVLTLTSGSPIESPLVIASPGMQPLPGNDCLFVMRPSIMPQSSGVTDTTVSIFWNPVQLPVNCTNAISLPNYTVRLSNAQGNMTMDSNYDTAVTLPGLTPYTEHSVEVSAWNLYTPVSLQDSLFGPPLAFTTTEGVPSQPRNLAVTVRGTRVLRAEWQTPAVLHGDPAAVRYMVLVSGASHVNVTTLGTDITGLDPATQYTVQVSAFNLVTGTGEAKIGTPTNPSPPIKTLSQPPSLNDSDTTSTTASLQFVFADITSIVTAVLQQCDGGTPANSMCDPQLCSSEEEWANVNDPRAVSTGETVNFTLQNLEPYQCYGYRIWGQYQNLSNGDTFSNPGERTFVRTRGDVPSTPVLRMGTATNTLVWDPLDSRSAMKILVLMFTGYSLDTGAQFKDLEAYSTGQTSISLSAVSGLEVGKRYNITMQAENNRGFSLESNTIDVTFEESIGLDPGVIAAVAVCACVLVMVCLVLFCLCMWCCCIHRQNMKHKDAITARWAYNRDYDEDIERLRILKFSRDDYRSREDYIFSGNDLDKLVQIPRDQIKLDSHIGQGAFGEVYSGSTAVEGQTDPVQVAIKVLHKEATEEQERSFLSEAIVMSHFNHENILSIIGVCVNNNPNFIIMELMEGGNLLEFMRGARRDGGSTLLTPSELAKISLDVANGAKYLEALKFIHRDLAARNCLVTSKSVDRVVKIGDFGLAKDLYSTDYYRKEGQGLLPVRWMPPESLQEGLFTTKSDVWAFGITLYEIWTLGFQPYPAKTNHEVFDLVIHGGRHERPDKCPNQMYNIMTHCWQQNPEDRPAFIEIAKKLQTYVDRLKTDSVCQDTDSMLEEPGDFGRTDSNRSWLRGSLRDSMRRIRSSIHRRDSLRGVRRQSSFKGDTNGVAFKESGLI